MKCTKFICAAIAAVSLYLTSTAVAGVLVRDTWLDGTDDDPASPIFSESGADSDSDGDLESAWFQGGSGSLNPVGLGGPQRGAVGTASASWTSYISAEGDEVNLVNHRDAVKVTWVFKLDGLGANNTSQNFRLTVVDSPAATRISANGTPGSGAYAGYAMFMNMGPTLGNSNPYRLMERGASGDILGTSGNWAPLGNGATTGNAGYANGVTYRYELLMTRNGASLDIVSTMTGGNLNNAGFAAVSLNDASPNSFAFDTFAVRPSNAATTAATFDTSLFQVEYFTPTVPEPASLTLVGLTALAMVVRRRR
ncbi:MAG: PEP-CTERM sorting domain-containing protein [Bythopirellula sp.]|nr:PEP-CTERM sorting domain-containing protein [Bythopirellula sp.]